MLQLFLRGTEMNLGIVFNMLFHSWIVIQFGSKLGETVHVWSIFWLYNDSQTLTTDTALLTVYLISFFLTNLFLEIFFNNNYNKMMNYIICNTSTYSLNIFSVFYSYVNW